MSDLGIMHTPAKVGNMSQGVTGKSMILREVARNLPKKIDRALPATVQRLPGTDRMPRYRVLKPKNAMDSLVGTTVAGRYYVLGMLGTGGMSVVYKAKSLRRARPTILALKTLRTQGLNDDVVVKRFQREAELLSHLNHPRIVQVHDYGYTAKGQPYFVMDYLFGHNLSQVISKEGPITVERARYIFTQVCGAVDHAHRCGVIHRDLKPGNIMLLNLEGERDFVKVVDFGIARFQTEASRLTRLGEVWGSPVYMSPEQCMGKPLDVRSDVYSIGIAMYEAVTGEVPFLGKNYVDTMGLQINEPARKFKEICPDMDIPERFEEVVLKALEKDPLQRYQSMGELREAIEDAFAKVPNSFRTSRNKVPAARVSRTRVSAVQPEPSSSVSSKSARKGRDKKKTKSPDFAIIILLCVWTIVAICLFAYANLHHNPNSLNSSDQEQGDWASDGKGGDQSPGTAPGATFDPSKPSGNKILQPTVDAGKN